MLFSELDTKVFILTCIELPLYLQSILSKWFQYIRCKPTFGTLEHYKEFNSIKQENLLGKTPFLGHHDL